MLIERKHKKEKEVLILTVITIIIGFINISYPDNKIITAIFILFILIVFVKVIILLKKNNDNNNDPDIHLFI